MRNEDEPAAESRTHRQASNAGCHFLDAESVTSSSVVDGVHLDADQHAKLGKALADPARDPLRACLKFLPRKSLTIELGTEHRRTGPPGCSVFSFK